MVPADTAVTTPVAVTVATAGTVLLQLPPAVPPAMVYVGVAPIQTGVVPLTVPAVTFAFTVMVWCEETGLPQPALTV